MGASSRVRFLQYLPYLEDEGIDVKVSSLFSNDYLQALYQGAAQKRRALALAGLLNRLRAITYAHNYDLVWIEKELIPFIPPFLELALSRRGVPYAVDFDDAIFHQYDRHRSRMVRRVLGKKIDTIMAQAAVVLAGNSYLAERARLAGARRIEVLPSVVDCDRYEAIHREPAASTTIGWIGTPKTTRYLRALDPVWQVVASSSDVKFVAIGANASDLRGTPWQAWDWSEEGEVKAIQSFDIGIMPLDASPWERGKCGYKLIQYMACGLPVVASPVGANSDIVEQGVTGLLPNSKQQWSADLLRLINDRALRVKLGCAARSHVERHFSVQTFAPRLKRVLAETLEARICAV